MPDTLLPAQRRPIFKEVLAIDMRRSNPEVFRLSIDCLLLEGLDVSFAINIIIHPVGIDLRVRDLQYKGDVMHGYKIVSYKVHGFYERTQAVDSYFVSQNNCVIFYRFNVESCAHVWSIVKPPSHFL